MKTRRISAFLISAALVSPLPAVTVNSSSALAQSCPALTDRTVAPPSTFDPLTAPNAELSCYGFPRRPSDPSRLAGWQEAMGHAKHYIPANMVQSNDRWSVITQLDSTRGAGYDVPPGQQNGTYQWSEVSATWNVPSVTLQVGQKLGVWTGLQNHTLSTSPLLQAGIGQLYGQSMRFFWEDYSTDQNDPCQRAFYDPNLIVHSGDKVYADVRWLGGTSYSAFWENITQNSYSRDSSSLNPGLTSKYANWGNAEYIVEETSNNYEYFTPDVNFSNCYLSAQTSPNVYIDSYIDQWYYLNRYYMHFGTYGGASAGSISATTHGFGITW